MSKDSFVRGKSISDLMTMGFDEFAQLSKPELRQVVSKLSSAANKRLARIDKADLLSPAAMDVAESGGKFGTKGKDLTELRIEYRRVLNFLGDKSSTVTGARELENRARKAVKDIYGIDIDPTTFKTIIGDYRAIVNESPDYISRALRYKYVYSDEYNVGATNSEISAEELGDEITEVLNSFYVRGGSQYDGVSNYFGFD